MGLVLVVLAGFGLVAAARARSSALRRVPTAGATVIARLPPYLQHAASIAVQNGTPHIAARIAHGAMRGESQIAESISSGGAVSPSWMGSSTYDDGTDDDDWVWEQVPRWREY